MDRLLCHLWRSEASEQETGAQDAAKVHVGSACRILGLKFFKLGSTLKHWGPMFHLGWPKCGAV